VAVATDQSKKKRAAKRRQREEALRRERAIALSGATGAPLAAVSVAEFKRLTGVSHATVSRWVADHTTQSVKVATEQIFLVIAERGDAYLAKVGGIAGVVAELPGDVTSIHCISINRLLADLRRDAAAKGVLMPKRLVPRYMSEEYVKWREAIDDPRGVEILRAFLKGGIEASRDVAAKRKPAR
jgi:hypothetical protein